MRRAALALAFVGLGAAGCRSSSDELSGGANDGHVDCPNAKCAADQTCKKIFGSADGSCVTPCTAVSTMDGCKDGATCFDVYTLKDAPAVCAPACDPLKPMCSADRVCLYGVYIGSDPQFHFNVGQGFGCVPKAATAQGELDACDYKDPLKACGPGLQCVPEADNQTTGTCMLLCDPTAAEPCKASKASPGQILGC